jgi:hypothetical protein
MKGINNGIKTVLRHTWGPRAKRLFILKPYAPGHSKLIILR